jgi:long-chain fatty acid transport protein
MHYRTHLLGLCVLALGLAPRAARATGFMIYEHNAAATAMAGARTALWDDPSSLFFNPAAIAELDGFHLQLGDTLIRGGTTYAPRSLAERTADPTYPGRPELDGTVPTQTEPKLFYPLHAYFTAEVTDWLALGVGLNNPFGLGTYWPAHWDGRYVAYQTELRTFFFQPVAALEIARLADLPDAWRLAFAAGGQYVYSDALIRQKVDLTSFPDATMELEGSAHGGGYAFSLFAAYLPWVSFGASVRSNVQLDFDGTAWFRDVSEATRAALANPLLGVVLPVSTGGTTGIELPWNMNFGVAFHGVPRLTIAADLYVGLWESYDTLVVEFACATDGSCWEQLNQRGIVPKNWKTALQASFGLEYRPLDALALRLGYGYATDPSDPQYYDPMLPDGNRHLICAGFGVRADEYFKFDVGYMLALWEGDKLNEIGAPSSPPPAANGYANGHYETVSHLLALTVTVNFGGEEEGAVQTLDTSVPASPVAEAF